MAELGRSRLSLPTRPVVPANDGLDLRLARKPDVPGAPWAGVVRCEAATDLSRPQLTALANLSQTVLCRYASVAYKDSRAPQNLVPIAGLENTLRHRLGDTRVLYRALRKAAQ